MDEIPGRHAVSAVTLGWTGLEPRDEKGVDMARIGILERLRNWLRREEQGEIRSDMAHGDYDAMTDRVSDHKRHMIDRIEDDL